GLEMRPARRAASPIVTLECRFERGSAAPGSAVRKYRSTADFTPYEPCPKYTVLRYCSRISLFEYLLLSRSARMISRTFRLTSRLLVRMRFFTSCCVIVEPPSSIAPDDRFFRNARSVELRSTPSFVQKVRSSTEITASRITLGM